MPLFVKSFAIPGRMISPLSWRDAWRYFFGLESITELITVVAFVADQGFGTWQARIDNFCPDVIRYLTCRQRHDDRFAVFIDDRVQF